MSIGSLTGPIITLCSTVAAPVSSCLPISQEPASGMGVFLPWPASRHICSQPAQALTSMSRTLAQGLDQRTATHHAAHARGGRPHPLEQLAALRPFPCVPFSPPYRPCLPARRTTRGATGTTPASSGASAAGCAAVKPSSVGRAGRQACGSRHAAPRTRQALAAARAAAGAHCLRGRADGRAGQAGGARAPNMAARRRRTSPSSSCVAFITR